MKPSCGAPRSTENLRVLLYSSWSDLTPRAAETGLDRLVMPFKVMEVLLSIESSPSELIYTCNPGNIMIARSSISSTLYK